MKHFPGLGITRHNTDTTVVKITASRTRLSTDLAPYRTAISHHIPLIMLSNATYTAYDTVNAAGWSPAIGGTLLRRDLGYTGATITDSLTGTARVTWRPRVPPGARRCARGDGLHPLDGLGGVVAGGLQPAARLCAGGDDLGHDPAGVIPADPRAEGAPLKRDARVGRLGTRAALKARL